MTTNAKITIGNTYAGDVGIFTGISREDARTGEWSVGVWNRRTGRHLYYDAAPTAYLAATWANNFAQFDAGEGVSMILNPAGYIVRDKEGYAIAASGDTEEQARVAAIENVAPFEDRNGNTVGPNDPDFGFEARFVIVPATAALLADVAENGGAIAWSEIDGVACTSTEADEE